MNRATVIAISVSALGVLNGCTDLKPAQNDIAELKTRVTALQSEVASVRSSADSAARSAAAAQSSADQAARSAASAQHTADQALSTAHTAQSGVKHIHAKLDRMFKKRRSK